MSLRCNPWMKESIPESAVFHALVLNTFTICSPVHCIFRDSAHLLWEKSVYLSRNSKFSIWHKLAVGL